MAEDQRKDSGMTLRTKPALAGAALATVLLGARPASADIPLAQYDGWHLSTDGRVNLFMSVAEGNGLPTQEPDVPGGGTEDTSTASNSLHSTRIRNGFLMSILGFTGFKEISPNFKVTARVGIWMNASGSATQNVAGQVDPRELYARIEGGWGSVTAGSDLELFGRGGILIDSRIAHEYGLGYPCAIRDTSGGSCGMVGFGTPFPGYNPGFVYASPRVAGFQLSLGIYDPATIDNAALDRAPLPRFDGELAFNFNDVIRAFGAGFWQVLEGTVQNTAAAGGEKDLHVNGWGAQAGAMVSLGPIMLGGAAYEGAGFSPIAALDDSPLSADSAGVLRNSRGVFGLGAVTIDPARLKIAGGLGLFHMDKDKNDVGIMDSTGAPTNPDLIEQNFGWTVGLYQTTAPVHFALEYFRAQSTWYPLGVASATDPTVTAGTLTPKQALNFVNAGVTVVW
jgi:Gram-negative porin